MKNIIIPQGTNPYHDEVQGKANEPITVAGLLDRVRERWGPGDLTYSLTEICDRLDENTPRIAIIGGSADHPAHILEYETTLKAAYRIWTNGGVPFAFGVPTMCDGTAQSHIGMSYSLQSRNAVTAMVVNQMESHAYHGAFVLQGCDKTPTAIVSALALLDVTRQRRGEAPVFATFAPAHVLRGGRIPEDLRAELEDIAARAEAAGSPTIAGDLGDTLQYILQCSSNQAAQGVLKRAVQEGLITPAVHKRIEKRLAVHTCHPAGGICAFNGTGNSSRLFTSALGLVHPAVELLTEPPTQEEINAAVDALFGFCTHAMYRVSHIVGQNIENAIRVHSATGGSTNLMMHIVAVMIHAGYRFDLWTLDQIRRKVPVPDLFDYSLTEGRDLYALAQQCRRGEIQGMETIVYELIQHGVPVNVDAPTVTGTTWAERLQDTDHLAAYGVKENPIVLSEPRRPFSGVDVLQGNFFESAMVKISGMTSPQIDAFGDKVLFVLYYENEEEANQGLLNVHLLDQLRAHPEITCDDLLTMYTHNRPPTHRSPEEIKGWGREDLFDHMIAEQVLKWAVVISGQGPEAYGMPEMFTPMQHINSNRTLSTLVVLLSDGRYSGVTYGAAIGHMTPEARNGGGILYLQTGDVVHLCLRERCIHLLDKHAFQKGTLTAYSGTLSRDRVRLGEERLKRIEARRRSIAPTNRLQDVTDAAHGVVPHIVAQEADQPYVVR